MNRRAPYGVHLLDERTEVGSDEELMTALYRDNAAVLRAFALRYVEDAARADDVVQETFLRAWRTLDRIDPRRGSPRAYLMTIARNVLTDQWRASRVRPQTRVATLPEPPTADDVDAALEHWLVEEALGRLTAEHRGVIQALYYDGRTVQEVAQLLGIPPGTVKSRSYYAVRALRVAFDELGVSR